MDTRGLIPISAIRNYMCEDPIVDWLNAYGRDHGYKPDNEHPGYLPECDFLQFIRRKDQEFETAILDLITTRIEIYSITAQDTSNESVISAMRSGIDAIYQPTLRDPEAGIIGTPDLLVRSDRLNLLIPNSITADEATKPARALGTPWHYRAVDIKFITVKLAANDEISNEGSQTFYKAQLALYTHILAKLQGHDPAAAYLLGRSWKKSEDRVNEALDRLLKVSFPQILNRGRDFRDWTSEAFEAVQWLEDLAHEGIAWSPLPEPTRDELRPNVKSDSNWRKAKQEIAQAQEDLTLLWQVGVTARSKAAQLGITKYTDPRLTAELVGLKNDQANTLNAFLETNLKPGPPVRPRSITAGRDTWGQIEPVEFYVDFETVSDLDDDFTALPNRGGYPGIFMIGCGHEENGRWQFQCFTAETLDEPGERQIIDAWLKHMASVTNRIAPDILQPIIYHWSAAEVSQAEKAYQSALKRLQEERLRGLNWFDLWKQVFKATPITVQGSWGFGLKGIAKNLQRHGLIQTTWADGPVDGLGAMAGAWWCYAESVATGNRIMSVETRAQSRRLMAEIRDYNEVDCRVMWEIVRYLRSSPTTIPYASSSTVVAADLELTRHWPDRSIEADINGGIDEELDDELDDEELDDEELDDEESDGNDGVLDLMEALRASVEAAKQRQATCDNHLQDDQCFCPFCGAEALNIWKFCRKCGAPQP